MPEAPITHKVSIYTTDTCAYCKMAKDFFVKNNVVYEEINVSRNPVKAQEMINISHQMGVPVIEIDSKIIIGFDKLKVKQLLGIN